MSNPILPTHRQPMDANRSKDGTTPLSKLHFDRKQTPRNLLSNITIFFANTWPDWLIVLIIGGMAAGIWVAPHAFTHLIPVNGPSGDIYWPEIAYPYIDPIFSSILAGVLSAAIPNLVILVSQLWIQSFDDFSYRVLGLVYSMATGTLFQLVLKKTIGGLRPHFLAVCQPVIPPLGGSTDVGFQNTMWTAEQICTGDPERIRLALESFPSGHSEAAFAGFGYLAIYLFAHLRIRSIRRKRRGYWRMLLVIAPILFATYLASTLVLGHHHHGYDVVFGTLIGWLVAIFGYSMVFPRWNTVLIVRDIQGNEGEESIEMSRQSRGRLDRNTAPQGARPSTDDRPERMIV